MRDYDGSTRAGVGICDGAVVANTVVAAVSVICRRTYTYGTSVLRCLRGGFSPSKLCAAVRVHVSSGTAHDALEERGWALFQLAITLYLADTTVRLYRLQYTVQL